jgi:hypothetical protein
MWNRKTWIGCLVLSALVLIPHGLVQATRPGQAGPTAARQPPGSSSAPQASTASPALRTALNTYCVGCHNERLKTAQLVLDTIDTEHLSANAETWEKVLKKVRVGAMPPAGPGRRRPNQAEHDAFLSMLAGAIDREAAAAPNPGRPPIHRLNRLQYTNAVRDLFGLEIDGRTMLPADDTGYGFDNIGDVLTISPGLLDRYLLAATKISRLVVGDSTMRPTQATYNVPYLSLGQNERMSEDLPFGSRGGVAIRHYFPLDGEYLIKIAVQRSDLADGYAVRGMAVANQIDVRLDRQRLKVFTLGGPSRGQGGGGGQQDDATDAGLEVRFAAKAGSHVVGVTFPQDRWEVEGIGLSQLPLTNDAYSRGRETAPSAGRIDMGIDRVEISGPFASLAPDSSVVRRRLFVCTPANAREEEPCARQILSTLSRRAFRRPVTAAEVDSLLGFYRQGRQDGNFEAGIQTAVTRLLVDVNFLFQLERDPDVVKAGAPYQVSDLELASRLSFFLWSSIPDDELLNLAVQGKLKTPAVLEQQVRRMLADGRAKALPESFFGQWLTTRNLVNSQPTPKVFPDFDENLRKAFQEETTLFLEAQLNDDRPAIELLTAKYTFVNDRLAKHYDIPNVLGSHFRRVALPDDSPRAGLLGQGSVLMVTAYNDRTSVVQRGKWILDNVFGTPPPPPPPGVPPFDKTEVKGTIRQRMEIHRKNPTCATCHSVIDPLGFALENFDATGKFRLLDSGSPVDPSGTLVDGTTFNGPVEFRKALLSHQDAFIDNLTVKLLTYALGRGVETYDMPAVRRIIGEAAAAEYRWSALITGIVKSMPFQMRRAVS